MLRFETYIFPEFHTLYDKVTDPHKDADNKGTQERFMETVGKEIDDNTMPYIDNMQDRLLEPQGAMPNLVPYLESELGYQLDWDWFFTMPLSFRRNLYDIMPKLLQIRGTLLAHQIMFGWLGYSITMFETYSDDTGFDSDDTFDSDTDTFDSTCEPCSTYTINLTGGGGWNANDVLAITTILEFNQSINAVLTDLTYSGGGITQDFTDFSLDFNYDFSGATPYIDDIPTGMILWCKSGLGYTTDEALINPSLVQWDDISGNDHHLIPITGTSHLTSANVYNGKQYVTLENTTILAVPDGISQWDGQGAVTVVLFMGIDGGSGSIGVASDNINPSDPKRFKVKYISTDEITAAMVTTVYGELTDSIDFYDGKVRIHTYIFDWGDGSTAVAPSVDISGLSGVHTIVTGSPEGFSPGAFCIGDIEGAGVVTGSVYEVIIFDHALDGAEVAQLNTYLTIMFGL
jgi:hypothetical protein